MNLTLSVLKPTKSPARPTRLSAATVVVGLLAGASTASAQSIYNSNGFEATAGFAPLITLAGQAGGTPPMFFVNSEASTTTQTSIQSSPTIPVNNGTQAVQLQYGSGGDFTPNSTYVQTPIDTVANPVVSIRFSMYVAPSTADDPAGGVLAPVFGVEVADDTLDPNGVGVQVAGLYASESTDGSNTGFADVLFLGAGNLFDTNTDVSLNEYHNFAFVLNYISKTYDLFVDGSNIGTQAFATGAADISFTDADLVAFDGGGNIEGLAFIDDFSIAIPEPTSLAAVLAVSAGLLGRRRRVGGR